MPNVPLSSAANIQSIQMKEGANAATPDAGYVRVFATSVGLYYIDDSGIVYPIRIPTKELTVMASDMWPSNTAGSAPLAKTELATNKVNYQSLDFDQTTQEHAEFSVWMPDDWNAGTLTFKVLWTAAAGSAAETVSWNLQARSSADDDALDGAWGSAVAVSDALIATGDLHVSAVSSALSVGNTPAAGEFVQFRVYRDIADTLAADAKLLGIKIYYRVGV